VGGGRKGGKKTLGNHRKDPETSWGETQFWQEGKSKKTKGKKKAPGRKIPEGGSWGGVQMVREVKHGGQKDVITIRKEKTRRKYSGGHGTTQNIEEPDHIKGRTGR